MDSPKFTKKEESPQAPKKSIKKLVLIVLSTMILTAAGLVLLGYLALASVFGAGEINQVAQGYFYPSLYLASEGGRTNFLLLGKSGAGFDTPDLTDTIIFASLAQTNSSATLVSLPRDIWLPDLVAKLNSAYYWGKKQNKGFELVTTSVEQIAGQKLHYVVVVDLNLLGRVIETLGGIEVDVETAFTDPKYPIAGKENDLCDGDRTYSCRYETIAFEKGRQFMDSAMALKFIRSRNAEGDEGTDLAREKRQQKVIEAIKAKVLSQEVLTSPKKIKALAQIAKTSVETNLPTPAIGSLIRLVVDKRQVTLKSYVLPAGMLINPKPTKKYLDQYVFIPRTGNWEELHSWIKSLLKN